MSTLGIGMIGCGAIALANHIPGFATAPDARIVALCDSSATVLQKAVGTTGISAAYTDYTELLTRADVDAVVIATPNHVHAPIAIAAARAGKHILCEKPIALSFEESMSMYRAAELAGVRHMTAFTYRFVPAMRYMAHLVKSGYIGQPYHFRAQRFQDWGSRPLGWRQVRSMAGTGELGDMLSHRIDYGHLLIGPIQRLVAQLRLFVEDRSGHKADVDDWVAMIADFSAGATGVLESSKLASGRGEGGRSHDYCEVNGAEGSLVYSLNKPLELQAGKRGTAGMETIRVPDEFLKWPGSNRRIGEGDPVVTFRYDQDVEFVRSIRENRPAVPSFREGAAAQAVMDCAVKSAAERRWVDVPQPQL